MGFDQILDQQMPVRLLKNMLSSGRIPNSLLFWGPGGVGKRTTAYTLIKAINCPQQTSDACGQCLSCRKIEHGNHPDVHLTIPVKKSRVIGGDAIDSVLELASLRPFEGQWRVFLISEAERMNGTAQNRLLKTLEEPPGLTVFILVTEQPQFLLPTIRSRCQSVRFGRLSPASVKELLMRNTGTDDATAESIAAVAQGQITRAIELAESDRRDVVFSFLKRLAGGDDPVSLAEELARYVSASRDAIETEIKGRAEHSESTSLSKEDRDRIKEEQQAAADALARRGIIELLYLIETWYRDKLVYRATQNDASVLNRDQLSSLVSAPEEDLEAKLNAITKARTYLERFLNEERVFRDLFFALAR